MKNNAIAKFKFPQCLSKWWDVFEDFAPLFSDLQAIKHEEFLEFENKFVVEVVLPRFKREETYVSVLDSQLHVNAKANERTVKYVYSIPVDVDMEKITSVLKNGVLTITLPKKKLFSKRIEVHTIE